MSKLYILSDVARLLKKRPHQITYAITSGLVPEPEMRIGGRRVFQCEDIGRLVAHFDTPTHRLAADLAAMLQQEEEGATTGKGKPCQSS
jgi:hypothetical protein